MTLSDADLAGFLVRDAGRLAAMMREEGVDAFQKTSVSDLVTAADRAAEHRIVQTLAEKRPDDGVLAEEGSTRESRSGRRWVIDPVDGTYNFVAGLDWWCSAVALVDGDDLVLGAVHHPATGRTFVGGPELPTRVDGVELPRLADRPLAESCLVTYLHPPFFGGDVGEVFARLANEAATLRMLGSGSMDATAVAEGGLHVLCQHTVPPWDELPGAAIIRGAGGSTAHIEAGGVTWYAAGAPTAVAEIERALQG